MKLCEADNRRVSHWLSPDLQLEFESINQATEFSNIHVSEESDGEVSAYEKYLEMLSKERKKVFVVGGEFALQNALSKKSIGCSSDSLSIGQDLSFVDDDEDEEDCAHSDLTNTKPDLSLDYNDDECFICQDGGGETNIVRLPMSHDSNLDSMLFRLACM